MGGDAILIVGAPSEWARDIITTLTSVSAEHLYVADLAGALALAEATERQPRLIVICRTPVEDVGDAGARLRAAFPASRLVIVDDTAA
jgi:hypothetical protein